MARKVAVMVRDRQSEAFRISAGLIVLDDVIDIFVLDRQVASDPDTQRNYELCKDMDLKIFTNKKENTDMEFLSTDAMADKLTEYDFIDPY
ncbi:MAG: hypothetical protein M0Z61_06195 [Nitrospiraceae bacterium]|nr:hypothetical protein [Nitrospiraceae bacterium]